MGPAQNSAVVNSVSGHKATCFSVQKVLAGEELLTQNEHFEMVFVPLASWVNFHLPLLLASQSGTKLLLFLETC